MAERSPEPNPTLRRILPLLFLGIAFAASLALFPGQFGSSPTETAPGAAATATAVAGGGSAAPAAAPAPEVDTSTRTQIWNLILVEPLMRGLRFLSSDLGLGAGLAIILFTIFIRIVLLPLTVQQLRSQKAMARLQPEIKALQKQYGKDREKLSAETMALYKQHGVNPAAGCLPMLLQMPILFALYWALSNLGEQDQSFQAPWLWVQSLQKPDVIHVGGVALPFILPILAAVTQWVQQRMMTQPTDDPQQRMQNSMMQFMPLMMLYFGTQFSSGLALYWVTQNLFGMVQQYFATGWGTLPVPSRAHLLPGAGNRGNTGSQDGARPPGGEPPPTPVSPAPAGRRAAAGLRTRDGGGRREGGRAPGERRDGGGRSVKREGRRASGKR